MDEPHVAVVTGGTGALGRAVSEALLDEGWIVHVPWRTRAHADSLAATIEGRSNRLRLIEADLTQAADVERLFASVDLGAGRLDALCNLAGGFVAGAVEETPVDAWQRMISANATATFLCCRAGVPRMKAGGGGAIVNVAAAAALAARPDMSAYVAAKAAVVALTRSLAVELAPHGITVNALAPSTIDTEQNRSAMPRANRTGWVTPGALADAVRWMLGPEGRRLTGSVLEFGR